MPLPRSNCPTFFPTGKIAVSFGSSAYATSNSLLQHGKLELLHVHGIKDVPPLPLQALYLKNDVAILHHHLQPVQPLIPTASTAQGTMMDRRTCRPSEGTSTMIMMPTLTGLTVGMTGSALVAWKKEGEWQKILFRQNSLSYLCRISKSAQWR